MPLKDEQETKLRRTSKSQWPRIKEARHKNGTKAWMVDARIDGRGERLFFKTKVEAETRAEQFRVKRKNEGTAGITIPEKLRVDAIECARKLEPFSVSLSEAVDSFITHTQKLEAFSVSLHEAVNYFIMHARPPSGIRQVRAIVDDFLQAKERANRRPEYLRVQRYILGKFCESFGEHAANRIHADDISAWLYGGPWSMRTRANYYNDLSNFFGFAVRGGYCAENPLARLDKPTVDEAGPPAIFTPIEAADLLNASERLGGKMTPFFALGLFAGLRTAELLKLDWRQIDLDAKTVEVTSDVSKTRNHRYVKLSDNLVAWLALHHRQHGPVRSAAWRWHRDAACKEAKLTRWPDNGMRHSFGSYHFAHHNNAAHTASEMGHRSETRTLFEHYRALVKPKDATTFWLIRPSSLGRK